jgi:uncharacterized membrane protein
LPKRIYTAFLISVGLWCLAIVAPAYLVAFGGPAGHSIADTLYLGFSKICHQIDDRSLHLFGVKFAVCVRCTSIYFSFFAGILVYPLFRTLDAASVPDRRWLLLAVLPMTADALLNDLKIHVSDDITRSVTGAIAGFVFAFYVVPLMIEAVNQIISHRHSQGDSGYARQT